MNCQYGTRTRKPKKASVWQTDVYTYSTNCPMQIYNLYLTSPSKKETKLRINMKRITLRKWLYRKRHYKNKLKYELICTGYKIDLLKERYYQRKSKTLLFTIQKNENSLYVNPLGVKASFMPF